MTSLSTEHWIVVPEVETYLESVDWSQLRCWSQNAMGAEPPYQHSGSLHDLRHLLYNTHNVEPLPIGSIDTWATHNNNYTEILPYVTHALLLTIDHRVEWDKIAWGNVVSCYTTCVEVAWVVSTENAEYEKIPGMTVTDVVTRCQEILYEARERHPQLVTYSESLPFTHNNYVQEELDHIQECFDEGIWLPQIDWATIQQNKRAL